MSRTFRVLVSTALVAAAAFVLAPPASAIADTCLYDSSTKIVTVVFPGTVNVSRTVSREHDGNKIEYNGAPCATATVKNTKTIYVITGAGAQNLEIDLSNGQFAPGVGAESSGVPEIEWIVDLGDGTDGITVTGGSGPDHIRYEGTNKIMLNGDADSDVSLSHTEVRYGYGGGGNDTLVASATTPTVTFYGGSGNDTLVGGNANDYLYGDGDNDTIKGNDGNDDLYGGSGTDHASGDDGNDTFYGGSGNDVFSGGYGGDDFYAESSSHDGADTFIGGPGNYDYASYYQRSTGVVAALDGKPDSGAVGEHDQIGKDVEELDGTPAKDHLTGNATDNYLYGDAGDDVMSGGAGDDYMYGNDGNDKMHGGTGDDVLYGNANNDTMWGDGGDDAFYADSTADGNDTMSGGTGQDQVSYSSRSLQVWVRLGGSLEGGATESDVIDKDIEIGYGGSAGDIMAGTNADNHLYGNGGNDTIDGGFGADTIYGGAGNDDLTGGDGADYVNGGDDNDTLHLTDGGTDYSDCGNGVDVASDRDAVDTSLANCETT